MRGARRWVIDGIGRGYGGKGKGMAQSEQPQLMISFSGSGDRSIRIWDWTKGRLMRVLEGHLGSVSCLEFHPNARYICSGLVVVT